VRAQLKAFPSTDTEFARFARDAWATLGEARTVEGLQDALRQRYPAAVVTIQHELARREDDPVVWYAYRMGAVVAADAGREASPPEAWPAWAIIDDERRFLEVSPELATIAELPVEVMLGRQLELFSNPADPTIREDIARLWREFERLREMSSTIRFNFRDGRPRELAYHVRADADGRGRHRLSVRVLQR
jgi:PAS domain-containing protein